MLTTLSFLESSGSPREELISAYTAPTPDKIWRQEDSPFSDGPRLGMSIIVAVDDMLQYDCIGSLKQNGFQLFQRMLRL